MTHASRQPRIRRGTVAVTAITVSSAVTLALAACATPSPAPRHAAAPGGTATAGGTSAVTPCLSDASIPPAATTTAGPTPTATAVSRFKPCPTIAGAGHGDRRYEAYRVGTAPWPAWDVEVAGRYAYVAGYDNSLRIVDLVDPRRPREVVDWTVAAGELGLPGGDVALDGHTAFIALPGDVLAVDVTDPTRPRTSEWLTAGNFDTAVRITVASGHLYDFAGGGVLFLGGSVPGKSPDVGQLMDSVPLDGDILDLAGGDGVLVASLGATGLQVVDLADPVQPRPAGRLDDGWPAYRSRIADGIAYVSEGSNDTLVSTGSLHLVDVRNVDAPREVGRWTPESEFEMGSARVVDADAADGRAVALVDDDGQRFWLVLLDVSDPAQPREIGRQSDGGWERLEDEPEVRLTGDLAVIAGGYAGLRVVDVSRPAIREVGAIDPPDGAFDVAVEGDVACVAAWSDGLRIMDVTDPAAAREVGRFDTDGYVVDVAMSGGYAFVAASEDGLRVVDVRTPAAPREVGTFEVPDWNSGESVQEGTVTGVDVVGDYAYVTSNDVDLTVLEVRDPAQPRPIGRWDGESGPTDVYVVAGVAYMPAWTRVDLVDVSDPAAPRHLGTLDVPVDESRLASTGVQDLAVDGDTMYVATGEDGVLVVDVSDATRPTVRQRLEPSPCANRSGREAMGVAVSGGTLWIALGAFCVRAYGLPETTIRPDRESGWCVREPGMDLLPGLPRRVRVFGDRVYVAASYGGLWIVQR